VIESFCKTRVRQSVSVQDTSLNTSGNSNKILTVPRTPDTASGESNGNGNDKWYLIISKKFIFFSILLI
jgi:hypothetical protein